MEEAQDQTTITQKRIKCGEIPKVEVDRISLLPDCLLVEILSRLPATEEAIRTGTLSKRWQYLWTYVPTLIFRDLSQSVPRSEFFWFVDNAITRCRQSKINKFELMTCYDIRFESQLNNWIRYAINCNVEKLTLMLWMMPWEADYHQQKSFYINSCFTHLRLSCCIVNPTGPISWKNLKTLTIAFVKLDEDLIQNILSGSPLLETWSLDCCYGYRRLDITSKSVKNLVVSGYAAPRGEDLTQFIIEINAPYILSLAIKDDLFLWKLLLLNVSSLVKANLDYLKSKHYEPTDNEEEEEMLKGLILNLRLVKELEIGNFCSEVLSRLEAEGFVLPSNLKILENDSSKLSDYSYSDSADSEDCEVDYGTNESSVSDWWGSDSDESGDWEMPLLDDGPNGDEAN